jgi:hypothetical protein
MSGRCKPAVVVTRPRASMTATLKRASVWTPGGEWVMGKEYDVGYGKPPVKNQFKKGKSGNPWGRLKLSREKQPLDPKKIAIAALKSLVTITVNGKKKKVTPMEAIWKSIIADALKGDKTARKYVVEFMMKLDKLDFEDDGVYFHRMTKERQKALDDFLEEFGPYEIVDNEEEGNDSSSGGLDNRKQGNGSSSGGSIIRNKEIARHRGALIIRDKEIARHPEDSCGSNNGCRSFDSAGRIARNHEEAIEAANVTTVRHRGPKLVTTWTLKFSSAIRQSGRSFVSPFAHQWRSNLLASQ